ncbi:hypothetical protein [Polyangium jinanense]|uniref:Uncharacterized protein n=1 Tax=Polyangium jinanense TaxID=2829994 RepID=A0A9X3WX71_9BACT|nr:hypothetical protein [Polyangium jinanense]MDC3953993.1 hypothetical protein [Polyangium jinanense]MDC3957794.1 hypothetical protein [Polyangium jinanense]MDC3978880.1 hypothetical protein [Polyangium jinanense]MDC3982051.1 hypothetical protein [Polyangium jinanense]
MKETKVQSPHRRGQPPAFGWLLVALAFLAMAGLAGACNLIVEGATDQCTTDADCSKFGNGSVCQEGVCVLPGGSSSSSGSGGSGGGEACFSGEPTNDEQYLNKCTDATCVDFDNCARLGLCNGAALPPLVEPTPVP